ncbi:toprim domain-containing protein [Candidatus Carsonella ruddii]|uniref:Putative DNA primase n=1 Tax=Candidatus Carsonella ruddii PC isolate NHV TaxID=1202540 RepID=J3TWH7_CARRU|nr:toprim domain-containing protein [Candidatus Carsonella ruddii]AFP84285.1 putative DNA primase [Candidatus Carsonella ruddii PC isolate NHV]
MNLKCPFHNDENASLSIKNNFFICYGCKKYGKTNFKFYKIKNFDNLFNKDVIYNARNNLLFQKNYWLNYLIKRNISFKTLLKYNLGYVNVNFKYNNKNRIIYNKLIFPIFNEFGILIGIGLKTKIDKPKYINLFKFNLNKKELLYGIYEKLYDKFLIIVEGYFDLLTLYENNIFNVISILGSNINEYQIFNLLKKFKKIVFCLDGDYSGYLGLLKLKFLKKKNNIKNLLFKCLPLNYDPDSYINKYGIKEFLKYLKICF